MDRSSVNVASRPHKTETSDSVLPRAHVVHSVELTVLCRLRTYPRKHRTATNLGTFSKKTPEPL